MDTPQTDALLLRRLAQVLHDMGLPCACQDEVERTVSIFAEFEMRRARRRLLEGARQNVSRLIAFIGYLDDLKSSEADDLVSDDISAMADSLRVIASTAAEAAAGLEMLASVIPQSKDL